MTPEDKKKLQKAFTDAAAKSPYADAPIPGMLSPTGTPLSLRTAIEQTLASEEFYKSVDQKMAEGLTLDDIIELGRQDQAEVEDVLRNKTKGQTFSAKFAKRDNPPAS